MRKIVSIDEGYAKKFVESHQLPERIAEKTEAISILEQQVATVTELIKNSANFDEKAENLDTLALFQRTIAKLTGERAELQKKLGGVKPESK